LEVTVYGIDDTIEEDVTLSDFSPDEKFNQEYYYVPEYYDDSADAPQLLFKEDLWYLDTSDQVKKLQEYLNQLGYFNGLANGYFGDETRMAIYLFQKDKGIIKDISELGAGHFGLQTRQELEKAVLNKKKDLSPKTNLGPDDSDSDNITKLQKLLNLAGYSVKTTGQYDEQTTKAVIKFQIDNGVVKSDADLGAGYFGPKTSSKLSLKLDELVKDGKTKLPVAHANEEVGALVESKAVLTTYMHTDLSLGSTGPEVKRLQKELASLSLLRSDVTGSYDEVTQHAVFKFQQTQGLVSTMDDEGAGVFGPQTRAKFNEILASKHYYNKLIAEKAVE
jgi:peptidoglycan hydrolase-like protein with peptidoglycan-binding domain